jgi:hypothetical protein
VSISLMATAGENPACSTCIYIVGHHGHVTRAAFRMLAKIDTLNMTRLKSLQRSAASSHRARECCEHGNERLPFSGRFSRGQ